VPTVQLPLVRPGPGLPAVGQRDGQPREPGRPRLLPVELLREPPTAPRLSAPPVSIPPVSMLRSPVLRLTALRLARAP